MSSRLPYTYCLSKVEGLHSGILRKYDPPAGALLKILDIFRTAIFIEHLWTVASELIRPK